MIDDDCELAGGLVEGVLDVVLVDIADADAARSESDGEQEQLEADDIISCDIDEIDCCYSTRGSEASSETGLEDEAASASLMSLAMYVRARGLELAQSCEGTTLEPLQKEEEEEEEEERLPRQEREDRPCHEHKAPQLESVKLARNHFACIARLSETYIAPMQESPFSAYIKGTPDTPAVDALLQDVLKSLASLLLQTRSGSRDLYIAAFGEEPSMHISQADISAHATIANVPVTTKVPVAPAQPRAQCGFDVSVPPSLAKKEVASLTVPAATENLPTLKVGRRAQRLLQLEATNRVNDSIGGRGTTLLEPPRVAQFGAAACPAAACPIGDLTPQMSRSNSTVLGPSSVKPLASPTDNVAACAGAPRIPIDEFSVGLTKRAPPSRHSSRPERPAPKECSIPPASVGSFTEIESGLSPSAPSSHAAFGMSSPMQRSCKALGSNDAGPDASFLPSIAKAPSAQPVLIPGNRHRPARPNTRSRHGGVDTLS